MTSNRPPTVFIVGGGFAYEDMFIAEGWSVVDTVDSADLIQFTGGEDVYPGLYGEGIHPTTNYNLARDRFEAVVYQLGLQTRVPMAGICRGGQFLNVMCGGKMWQNVNNHAIYGTHDAFSDLYDEGYKVTSTHHQMMIPGDTGHVILWATIANCREEMPMGSTKPVVRLSKEALDTEAVWYQKNKVMCFQPHPEYDNAPSDCTKLYFQMLWDLLDVGIFEEEEPELPDLPYERNEM